jgi:hypothetical protein
MAQLNWIFLDSQGGRHKVGLYHGDRSGHLVIYCNMQVVQVDFSVKESKSYSFFIEEEFCEIRLVKEDGRFFYEFHVDKKVDTPLNRARKLERARERKKLVWVTALILTVLGLGVWGLLSYGWQQEAKRRVENGWHQAFPPDWERKLRRDGRTAYAKMYVQPGTDTRKIVYGFTTADSLKVSGSFILPDTGQVYLPGGLPLKDEDTFEVRYLPGDERIHRIDFSHPTANTIKRYVEIAALAEMQAHPQTDSRRAVCMAATIMENLGWESLGHVIFQQDSEAKNPRYNQNSYLRLVREPRLAEALKNNCWAE